MPRASGMRLAGSVLWVLLGLLWFAAPVPAAGWMRQVPVVAPARPMPVDSVTVHLQPRGRLPKGGYYYAVAVLSRLHEAEPQCAVSSDMSKTGYGFPHRHGVKLTLLPAASPLHEWCYGGIYEGAVYAVPHRPPCSIDYPCYGRRACGGVTFCGVVRKPYYSYPGGLPPPIDAQSRIVGRFRLSFPFASTEQLASLPQRASLLAVALAAAKLDGDDHPSQVEAVRTTHGRAQRLLDESSSPPPADTPVYLLAMRGHFTCDACTFPQGAKAPSGTVVTLEIEAATMKGLGFSLGRRYPTLERVGVPMRLD